MWEKENGRGPQVSLLKDLVNPCQRLVQKVRYAGLEREFSRIVNTEGFDAEGWAYTCDKAVKAYRVSMLTRSVVAGILMYRQGVYDAFRDIAGERMEICSGKRYRRFWKCMRRRRPTCWRRAKPERTRQKDY